jgi:hypothetical protein
MALKTSVNGSEDIVKYSIASNLLMYIYGVLQKLEKNFTDGKSIVFTIIKLVRETASNVLLTVFELGVIRIG